MLKLVTHIKESTQIKWHRLGKFKPTIQLQMELGPYTIKTADSIEELLKAFRLRHEVFHQEFREVLRSGLDVDKHDRSFDHLLIIHNPTQKIVGTYRLRATLEPTKAYTAQEFTMAQLTGFQAPYLELGRACIQAEHRKGAVMSLLFRGIAEYMNRSGAKTLFGCSSVKIHQPRSAALLYQYLLQNNHVWKTTVQPTDDYLMPEFGLWFQRWSASLDPQATQEAESLVPPLVKMYLKMGAKIACEPAFDREFNCIDLLTVLKTEQLEETLARKYQVVKI